MEIKKGTLEAVQSGVAISGVAIGNDNAITFANNAAANTQVNVDIAQPTVVKTRYALVTYNPSTVTDLTVKVFAVETSLAAATRYALLTTISVGKSATVTGTTVNTRLNIIEGLFVGSALRLVVSNDTVLGAAEGFSAYARLREV